MGRQRRMERWRRVESINISDEGLNGHAGGSSCSRRSHIEENEKLTTFWGIGATITLAQECQRLEREVKNLVRRVKEGEERKLATSVQDGARGREREH